MPGGRPRVHVAPCKFCHKQFKRHEHLQRHERIHTQEKPFACKCGEGFTRRDLLTRHRRQHHLSSASPDEHAEGADALDADATPPGDIDCENTAQLEAAEHSPMPVEPVTTQPTLASPVSNEQDADHVAQAPSEVAVTEALHDAEAPFPVEPPFADSSLFPAESDFLFTATDSDLDFLWNDLPVNHQPLPPDLLTTDLSLHDISQHYAALPPLDRGNFCLHPSNQDSNQQQHAPPLSETHPIISDGEGAMATRLPSLEPEPTNRPRIDPALHSRTGSGYRPFTTTQGQLVICPWRVSVDCYRALSETLSSLASLLPFSFSFPSRHTLSRYLEGYFRGFHAHLPFFHISSLSLETLGPEVVLALASVGALYRFEHAKGFELYHVSRALINQRLGMLHQSGLSRLTTLSPGYAGFPHPRAGAQRDHGVAGLESPEPTATRRESIKLVQGLIVLMAVASWSERVLVHDALSIAGQVAALAREIGLDRFEGVDDLSLSWKEWLFEEERRRTLFVVYIFFNLQCIAFNVPPMILNAEIHLDLPSSAAEWNAYDEQSWSSARSPERLVRRPFQEALHRLLSGQTIHEQAPVSSFGNYVLVHGLFQHIFFARHSGNVLPGPASTLGDDFVKRIEVALRAWQESWEATSESTLDPSSPKGPLGFNSSALLRLAYIRLNCNTGPGRQLMYRDPQRLAEVFHCDAAQSCTRSPHLDQAILQCIHALSVPVRVGIAFVARTQTLNWSVQHSLCNLECALLMSRWLRLLASVIESSGLHSLRKDEHRLLNMLASLVRETSFAKDVNATHDPVEQIRRLEAATVNLWAETFKGFQVFEIVHTIGVGLSAVVDELDC